MEFFKRGRGADPHPIERAVDEDGVIRKADVAVQVDKDAVIAIQIGVDVYDIVILSAALYLD